MARWLPRGPVVTELSVALQRGCQFSGWGAVLGFAPSVVRAAGRPPKALRAVMMVSGTQRGERHHAMPACGPHRGQAAWLLLTVLNFIQKDPETQDHTAGWQSWDLSPSCLCPHLTPLSPPHTSNPTSCLRPHLTPLFPPHASIPTLPHGKGDKGSQTCSR